MKILRNESVVLLACVSAAAPFMTVHAQTSGGVAATVPVAESIAPDSAFLPPVGWNETAHVVVGDRLVAQRSSQSATGSAYFVEVVRSPSGEWMEPRPLAVEGMPVPAVTFNRFATDGIGTFVYRAVAANGSSGDYQVVRRAGSGWELLPPFPAALGAPSPVRAKETSLIARQGGMARLYAVKGGAWVETRAIAPTEVGLTSIELAGDIGGGFVVLQGEVDPSHWDAAAGSIRCVVVNATDATMAPMQVPASASVQRSACTASGEGLVAIREYAVGVALQSQRVFEVEQGGTLSERLSWQSRGIEGAPSRIGPGGSLIGSRWIRPRNAAGGWNPALWLGGNTFVAPQPVGIDGDVLAFSSGVGDASLAVFRSPWDIDDNGVRDGDEIQAGAAVDCNRNGVPDAADVSSGRLVDADADGIPDACVEDCDANGVPDLTDLRDGALETCVGTGGLARCAIADGAADSDGDGVPDECSPDRNRNGIPDEVEIASGAIDCDGDRIPNGAPVLGAVAEGLVTPDEFVGWSVFWSANATGLGLVGCYFPLSEPLRIDGVQFRVAIGADPTHPTSPVGRPYHLFVSQALTSAAALPQSEVVWTATGSYRNSDLQSMPTPPVVLHPPGFFVSYSVPAGAFAPLFSGIPLDQRAAIRALTTGAAATGDPLGGRGWGIFSGQPSVTAPELLALATRFPWLPDIEVVANGCPMDGDFDGDGRVSGRDLGLLLGAWGPTNGSPCDLNGDGSVDGLDLGILLGNFSAGA
jgi:hypothetical protein